MAENSGKIFINYRRSVAEAWAGRLHDALEPEFGRDRLFMDVDAIPAGVDFVDFLDRQVAECGVFLALIADGWLDASTKEDESRRLDDPKDYVRLEIEAALKREIRVIPVLLGEARMPSEEALPEPLTPLARRNAVRLQHASFKRDTTGLVKQIEAGLAEAEASEAARLEAAAVERAEREAKAARDEAERRRLLEAERASLGPDLSPEQLRRAEELANWEFVKDKRDGDLLRDHLARYGGGVSEPWAREALEAADWAALGRKPSAKALQKFIDEHPDGANRDKADKRLAAARANAKADAAAARRRRYAEARWAAVGNTDSAALLRDFAAEFPESPQSAEALRRAQEVEKKTVTLPREAVLFAVALLLLLTVLTMVGPLSLV